MGLLDFVYNIERFFGGERGIVEEVELQSDCCLSPKLPLISQSADFIPVKVVLRNPSGELIERVVYEKYAVGKYKPGDKFP